MKAKVQISPRSFPKKLADFITFPLRAFCLIEEDSLGLSSLRSERFDYASQFVGGYCLDIGCGRHNAFIKEYLKGYGVGVDVYPYAGLSKNQVFADLKAFPFADSTFNTVTFIASINHVPKSQRDAELRESYRCLKPGGNIIITMGNPLAELIIHQVLFSYDKFLGTNLDVDTERGMSDEESYFLTDKEIISRLTKAGFQGLQKKYFWTQWGLNHLFIGQKPKLNLF